MDMYRQYNWKKKKDKNKKSSTKHYTINDRESRTPLKTGMNLGAPEE